MGGGGVGVGRRVQISPSIPANILLRIAETVTAAKLLSHGLIGKSREWGGALRFGCGRVMLLGI